MDVGIKHLYFNTLSDNLDRVTRAIGCLKNIEKEYLFFGFCSRLRPVVEAISKKYYINELHIVDTVWYQVSKDVIDTFKIE